MKIKDLITKLEGFDSETEVVFFSEYDSLAFELIDISEREATKTRANDKPFLKFGKSETSKTYVVCELSSDV